VAGQSTSAESPNVLLQVKASMVTVAFPWRELQTHLLERQLEYEDLSENEFNRAVEMVMVNTESANVYLVIKNTASRTHFLQAKLEKLKLMSKQQVCTIQFSDSYYVAPNNVVFPHRICNPIPYMQLPLHGPRV
jgi:hypothetical protein